MLPNAQRAANVQRRRKEAEMNTQKLTMLYSRLSRDDELQGPSNSILNQQQMLQEYAERNGMIPYLHVSDDGYSGTNYNRPGWQELIGKVEAGEVSTIICKNLDRMGRNYLQTGLYREMFGERGVRLICVNDGIDTFVNDDDFTPFREILAEWYARDTSKKVKSVLTAKGKSGKPLTCHPPYGFVKDPNDKYRWLVDPESAAVIKRIFRMALEGIGPYEIAKRLSADQVECPSYYMGSRGRGVYQNKYKKDQPYTWWCSTVEGILSRLEYCGHTVNFRTAKTSYKTKHTKENPQEEWLIFENTHDAIIKQETFDTIQKLRGTPRRIHRFGDTHPLTGLLWCADCGAKLYNRRGLGYPKKDRNGNFRICAPIDIYECGTHKLLSKRPGPKCSSHHIRTESVKEIILDALQRTSGYVREHEAEFVELVRTQSAIRNGETAKACKKHITKNERRISELDKLIISIYEDKVKGLLPEERFTQMAATYEQEQATLKQQTATLQAEMDAYDADSVRADKFVDLLRHYTQFDELTGSMIAEFIDKIIIHEGEWSEGIDPATKRGAGTRSQHVEVYLKYIGKFDIPDLRTAEEIEAETIAAEKKERKRRLRRESTRRYEARKREAKKLAKQTA